MNSIEQPDLHSKMISLERRLLRAERGVVAHRICLITTLVLVLFPVWTNRFRVVQAQSDKLRLRELDIVDENGRERIVIASPIPQPVANGKTGHRIRVVSAAVQFKAIDGSEQGGIALSDDGSFMFGIDDEHGRERAHLYYIPKRGSGVYLQGENDKETVSLLLPSGGENPKLQMTDQTGKQTAIVPSEK